jgi:hypothetical protein
MSDVLGNVIYCRTIYIREKEYQKKFMLWKRLIEKVERSNTMNYMNIPSFRKFLHNDYSCNL